MGYVRDFCISHFKQEQKDEAYRIYITDCLRIITENSAHLGNDCKYLKIRYYDLVSEHKEVEETRTPEEIISRIGGVLDQLGGENNG